MSQFGSETKIDVCIKCGQSYTRGLYHLHRCLKKVEENNSLWSDGKMSNLTRCVICQADYLLAMGHVCITQQNKFTNDTADIKYGDPVINEKVLDEMEKENKKMAQRLDHTSMPAPGLKKMFESSDQVNHPSHYTTGKIEVIDFIEDQKLDFHDSQVVKYVVRAKHKGNELQDLKKAQWYLNRKIGLLETLNASKA